MGLLGTPRRRISAVATAAVVAAVGVVVAPQVFAAGPRTTTLHFREPSTNVTFVDVGKKGSSQGDYLVWDDPLKDVKTGKVVGRVLGTCTLVDVASQTFDCGRVDYILKDGMISNGGPFSGKGKPGESPILGGTGKYANVHGTVLARQVSSTVTDHVITIEG